MQEVWKDVFGYEGLYQVSSFGRVKSLERIDSNNHRWPERILKGIRTPKGYLQVKLCKRGEVKSVSVHRLVATAFIEKPNPKYNIINHLDCDGTNNEVSNLEWTDYKGNMQYASKLGRMKYNPSNLKKAQESHNTAVIAISADGKRQLFRSQAEAANILHVSRGHIAACCRKEYGYKTVGGYSFEYADEERKIKAKPKKVGMSKEEVIEITRKRMIGNKYNNGKKLSEETKKKISQSLSMPVVQYDKNGIEIAKYHSAKEAKELTGISHINDAAAGRRKTAGKFYWRFLNDIK